MNYPERSQEIVPLVPIQAWPGWMPTIMQELKRYGEPRHETHDSSRMADNNSTQRMRSKPYSRRDRSSRTRGRRSDRWTCIRDSPLWDQEVSWFRYPSFFDHFITYNYAASGTMAGPNAGTSRTVDMDDCNCHISTCIRVGGGCNDGINVDSLHGDYYKCTNTCGKSF